MKQQANSASVAVLDEMTKTLDTIYCDSSEGGEVRGLYDAMKGILGEAKSRIQALGESSNDGWHECEKEMPKDNGYYLVWGDTMNVFDGKPRVMDFQGEYFECGDGAEFPTHWMLLIPPNK